MNGIAYVALADGYIEAGALVEIVGYEEGADGLLYPVVRMIPSEITQLLLSIPDDVIQGFLVANKELLNDG